ncbi:glycosyltransferase [Silvibacterium sp.]|uniref:glycosyltransferase n=1 Tax=Silvibacterium sp. TaxID=1964179 RepID=UPI0039E5EFB9
MMLPALSVVVIGRNEGQRLVRCLHSVSAIRDRVVSLEILYVDSSSTDNSMATASAMGAKVIALEAEHPTAALGRNAGWREASSDHVLFLDGDTVLDPEFPGRAFAALATDDRIAAVWGHRRELHPEASLYNRILDLDWVYPPGPAEFCGGDVLMRRAALEVVGGYDGTLIAGEEPELCRRLRALGSIILHIDAPMTGHDLEMRRFRQYWRRALRAGHAYAEVSGRFRRTGDPFWQDVRLANFKRGGFWAGSALLALLLTLLLRSPWPLLAWLTVLFVLAARSASKASWKSRDTMTLFLYGLHSHLQQVPILFGQIGYELGRRRQGPRKLIEYKGASS